MRIHVNGTAHDVGDATTVEDVVDRVLTTDDRRGTAVAVDGEVVPRAAWTDTRLADGATVEVLRAVQGGSR